MLRNAPSATPPLLCLPSLTNRPPPPVLSLLLSGQCRSSSSSVPHTPSTSSTSTSRLQHSRLQHPPPSPSSPPVSSPYKETIGDHFLTVPSDFFLRAHKLIIKRVLEIQKDVQSESPIRPLHIIPISFCLRVLKLLSEASNATVREWSLRKPKRFGVCPIDPLYHHDVLKELVNLDEMVGGPFPKNDLLPHRRFPILAASDSIVGAYVDSLFHMGKRPQTPLHLIALSQGDVAVVLRHFYKRGFYKAMVLVAMHYGKMLSLIKEGVLFTVKAEETKQYMEDDELSQKSDNIDEDISSSPSDVNWDVSTHSISLRVLILKMGYDRVVSQFSQPNRRVDVVIRQSIEEWKERPYSKVIEYLCAMAILDNQYLNYTNGEVFEFMKYISLSQPSDHPRGDLETLSPLYGRSSPPLSSPSEQYTMSKPSPLPSLLRLLPSLPTVYLYLFYSICFQPAINLSMKSRQINDSLHFFSSFVDKVLRNEFRPQGMEDPHRVKAVHERMYNLLLTFLRERGHSQMLRSVGTKFMDGMRSSFSLISTFEYWFYQHSPYTWVNTPSTVHDAPIVDHYNGAPMRVSVEIYWSLFKWLLALQMNDRVTQYFTHYLRYSVSNLIVRNDIAIGRQFDRRIFLLAISTFAKPSAAIGWEGREQGTKTALSMESSASPSDNHFSSTASSLSSLFPPSLPAVSPIYDSSHPSLLRRRLKTFLFHFVMTLPKMEVERTDIGNEDELFEGLSPSSEPLSSPSWNFWMFSSLKGVLQTKFSTLEMNLKVLDQLFNILMAMREYSEAVKVFRFLCHEEWMQSKGKPLPAQAVYPSNVADTNVEPSTSPPSGASSAPPSSLPLSTHIDIVLNHIRLSALSTLASIDVVQPTDIHFVFSVEDVAKVALPVLASQSQLEPLLAFLDAYHSSVATTCVEYEDAGASIVSPKNIEHRIALFQESYALAMAAFTGQVIQQPETIMIDMGESHLGKNTSKSEKNVKGGSLTDNDDEGVLLAEPNIAENPADVFPKPKEFPHSAIYDRTYREWSGDKVESFVVPSIPLPQFQQHVHMYASLIRHHLEKREILPLPPQWHPSILTRSRKFVSEEIRFDDTKKAHSSWRSRLRNLLMKQQQELYVEKRAKKPTEWTDETEVETRHSVNLDRFICTVPYPTPIVHRLWTLLWYRSQLQVQLRRCKKSLRRIIEDVPISSLLADAAIVTENHSTAPPALSVDVAAKYASTLSHLSPCVKEIRLCYEMIHSHLTVESVRSEVIGPYPHSETWQYGAMFASVMFHCEMSHFNEFNEWKAVILSDMHGLSGAVVSRLMQLAAFCDMKAWIVFGKEFNKARQLADVIRKWEDEVGGMRERLEKKSKAAALRDERKEKEGNVSIPNSADLASLLSPVHLSELLILACQRGHPFSTLMHILSLISLSLTHCEPPVSSQSESCRAFRLMCVASGIYSRNPSTAMKNGDKANMFSVVKNQYVTMRSMFDEQLDGPLFVDVWYAAVCSQMDHNEVEQIIVSPLLKWMSVQSDSVKSSTVRYLKWSIMSLLHSDVRIPHVDFGRTSLFEVDWERANYESLHPKAGGGVEGTGTAADEAASATSIYEEFETCRKDFEHIAFKVGNAERENTDSKYVKHIESILTRLGSEYMCE